MKKSRWKGESPSQLIEARIKELGVPVAAYARTVAGVGLVELYVRGLVDFLQRSLYVAQDQRVQSEGTLVLSLIALYKALGGGWEATEVRP